MIGRVDNIHIAVRAESASRDFKAPVETPGTLRERNSPNVSVTNWSVRQFSGSRSVVKAMLSAPIMTGPLYLRRESRFYLHARMTDQDQFLEYRHSASCSMWVRPVLSQNSLSTGIFYGCCPVDSARLFRRSRSEPTGQIQVAFWCVKGNKPCMRTASWRQAARSEKIFS